jgi:protein gp37
MAFRLAKMGKLGYADVAVTRGWTGKVNVLRSKLEEPLGWKKPRRVFVNSMSDLFHEALVAKPEWSEVLTDMWQTMAATPKHTYLILTKRPHIMEREVKLLIAEAGFPVLPNVWLGTSISIQRDRDRFLPYLLETPAAKRFVSCEPLLGPVHLLGSVKTQDHWYPAPLRGGMIDWVICGGESGPGARPMHPDWARGLRDQCQAAGVPFFFKQWGEFHPAFEGKDFEATCAVCGCSDNDPCEGGCYWIGDERADDDMRDRCSQCKGVKCHRWPDGSYSYRVRKRVAGRLLDGQAWDEYPITGRETA